MGARVDCRLVVKRSVLAAAFACVPLLVTACGALLNLDPLVFDEPLSEAGADVATDTSTTDAALRDGDGGGDAATSTHCSDGKRHDFCDDFEGITGEIQDRWNKRKEVTGTGSIAAIESDAAPSPTTIFRSMIDRGPDGGMEVHIARLSKQQSPWPRTDAGEQAGSRIAFEASFIALDDLTEVTLANVMIGASVIEDSIAILAKREGDDVVFRISEVYGADGGAVVYAGKPIATRISLRQWTHFEIEIQERGTGTGGANVTVGTATTSYTLESSSRIPYFRADVGSAIGTFAGAQAHILYDNVRIDYLP